MQLILNYTLNTLLNSNISNKMHAFISNRWPSRVTHFQANEAGICAKKLKNYIHKDFCISSQRLATVRNLSFIVEFISPGD